MSALLSDQFTRKLETLAQAKAGEYKTNQPYPHIYIDNFLPFAIFSTTSVSFHGHPVPLACPPDRNRKSIATYYYSNGRPEEDPGLTHNHDVAFQQRPGVNRVKASLGVRKVIKSLTPPILTDLYRGLRK